jgi:hypothetical protein
MKTGLALFPYGLLMGDLVAVSDRPIAFDAERWMEVMKSTRLRGEPVVDGRDADSWTRLEVRARAIQAHCETRESLLSRISGARIITDDNMGEEWSAGSER